MYLLYEVLLYLVLLLALPYFLLTGVLRGKYLANFPARMGFYRHRPEAHELWVHAVSVGEALAARPVIEEIVRQRPGTTIVFTTTTLTGQAQARRMYPEATVTFFPFDFAFAVRRFLDHHEPRVFATMETEIWPNVTRIARKRGLRLLLANGRISDRSLPRYRAFRRIVGSVLAKYDRILAREETDRERFVAIGGRPEVVEVSGNVKFDYEPDDAPLEIAPRLASLIGGRKVFVLGSTMEGEDEALLPEIERFIAEHDAFVIIAPRKPERFELVAGLLATSSLRFLRRSAMTASASDVPADVLLLDTLGELAKIYRCATVAFVGGTLVPIGGHNPIEPAANGVPVCFGPSMSNFREIAEVFLRAEAAEEVKTAAEAIEFAAKMFEDEELQRAWGARAPDRPPEPRRLGAHGRADCGASGVKVLLRTAELGYRGINRARRALYRAGVLRGKKLPRPVISVGNIGTGGAGKTPAVITVCRFLEDRGLRIAVLTRGYGRRDHSYTGIIDDFDADKFGDEPVLIKNSIQGDVIVGSKRHRNAVEYLSRNQCDVFVLDDGFQHLQLHRDFDLVVDAPARFHREGRGAFRHADAVIPRRLRAIVPAGLHGKRVFAFAGLANNEQFFNDLRVEGVELAGTRGFPDHHRYTPQDLAALRRDAGGATLVTTGKDAVKIDDPDIVTIGAEMVIDDDVLERALRVASGGTPPGQPAETPAVRRKKRRKSMLLQRIEYAAYRFVSKRVASMSDQSLLRWGTRLGALARHVLRGRDRLAMRNLRTIFPERDERERRAIVDESWRHFGREMLRYLHLRNATLEELDAHTSFGDSHHLDESIARGNGTIFISAHFGGWEIGGLALLSHVRNVVMVARPLDNELLERDLQRLREKTGARVVDRRRAARSLLRSLAENAVVLLLPDQAVLPREGVLVPFLGRPAWTTAMPAKMALRANATIVFAFCIPDGLRHRVEFVDSIRVDQLGEDDRDPVKLTKRINDVISARITARPELWLWMHDRWKGTGERGRANGV